MVDQFGDAYRAYQARTGALLPEGGLTFLLSGAVAYAMLAGTAGATRACSGGSSAARADDELLSRGRGGDSGRV